MSRHAVLTTIAVAVLSLSVLGPPVQAQERFAGASCRPGRREGLDRALGQSDPDPHSLDLLDALHHRWVDLLGSLNWPQLLRDVSTRYSNSTCSIRVSTSAFERIAPI